MTISKKKIMNYLNSTIESLKDSFTRELYYVCEEEAIELIGICWFLWRNNLIDQITRENYLDIAYNFKDNSFALKRM